jgi:hypothetical protein
MVRLLVGNLPVPAGIRMDDEWLAAQSTNSVIKMPRTRK